MTTNRADDIRWVASEVADLAVLLHAHGLKHLAFKLNVVQEALRAVARPAFVEQKSFHNRRTYGKVVRLESFRN